ncbi:MAG: hypothetical protein IPL27_25080 [Lewinellaceae bacterium]|nr:hypothetical protein [Lewinellaceae bacterium]
MYYLSIGQWLKSIHFALKSLPLISEDQHKEVIEKEILQLQGVDDQLQIFIDNPTSWEELVSNHKDESVSPLLDKIYDVKDQKIKDLVTDLRIKF